MTFELVIQALGLGAVLLLLLLDLRAVEERARVARQRELARARVVSEQKRCPYCHLPFEEDPPEDLHVGCASCGTRHHASCWADHGRCCVFGCEAREAKERPRERAATQSGSPG